MNIAMLYIGVQKWRGSVYMSKDIGANSWRWKWALSLLCLGVTGMTVALLISGYEQSFIERALGGATWAAYFEAQQTVWYVQGMFWRQIWGYVTALGLIILIWDLLTIDKGETRPMVTPQTEKIESAA